MAVGKAREDRQLLDNRLVQIGFDLTTGKTDQDKLSCLSREPNALREGCSGSTTLDGNIRSQTIGPIQNRIEGIRLRIDDDVGTQVLAQRKTMLITPVLSMWQKRLPL